MGHLTKQQEIEEIFFEMIEEIAGEIELAIPYYPSVYWVGRGVEFEDISLPERFEEMYQDEFDIVKHKKRGYYLDLPKIALVGSQHVESMSEEAAHFLHFANSGIRQNGRDASNRFALNALIEMLGYFGSKIIMPERTPAPYDRYRDFFPLNEEERKSLDEQLRKDYGNDVDLREFYIYQQGYVLGEMLFYRFSREEFSAKRIKRLFKNPLSKPDDAINTLLKLKRELCGKV